MQLYMMIPPRSSFDNKISDILHRPEYRHLKNGIRDLMQSLQENLGQLLRRMFEKAELNTGTNIPDRLAVIFIIIGLAAILGIVVLIIVRTSKAFEKRSKLKVILGEKLSDKTTPNSLREKASVLLHSGDMRQAIRYDFIALLLLMHEKRLIYIDETKTNQEIYNYLKKGGFGPVQVFQGMTGIFDSVWYGHKDGGGEVYDAWSRDLALLWNEVMSCEVKNK